jgi:hypothetical protein
MIFFIVLVEKIKFYRKAETNIIFFFFLLCFRSLTHSQHWLTYWRILYKCFWKLRALKDWISPNYFLWFIVSFTGMFLFARFRNSFSWEQALFWNNFGSTFYYISPFLKNKTDSMRERKKKWKREEKIYQSLSNTRNP